jgi:hypothetical protein
MIHRIDFTEAQFAVVDRINSFFHRAHSAAAHYETDPLGARRMKVVPSHVLVHPETFKLLRDIAETFGGISFEAYDHPNLINRGVLGRIAGNQVKAGPREGILEIVYKQRSLGRYDGSIPYAHNTRVPLW